MTDTLPQAAQPDNGEQKPEKPLTMEEIERLIMQDIMKTVQEKLKQEESEWVDKILYGTNGKPSI